MTDVWIVTATARIASLVDAGRRLGGTLTVVAAGDGVYAGADVVRRVGLPAGVPAEAAAGVVAGLVEARPGDVVLVPDLPAERVLAGAVAARLGAPIVTGAVGVAEGAVTVARFGGIALETVTSTAPIVVLLHCADEDAEVAGGEVAAAAVSGELLPARVVTETTGAAASGNLRDAARIVAAGRGFASEADLALARDLAEALDAEVACSRPLAEGLGWLPRSSYVGVSGQTVKPELYVAVGISGQLQHLAGVREAGTIVAINSDRNAPIFRQADYGIVGDLHTILPALASALRQG